jgi:hypothetical protein
MNGAGISQSDAAVKSQITNIEKDGFWLLTNDGEFFISFEQYPAFKKATVEQIFDFAEHFGDFYWERLDIDIELEALKHPENYPLKFE